MVKRLNEERNEKIMTTNIRKFEEIDTEFTFNMNPKEIKLIKDRTKKSVVKSFYIPIEQKEIGIVNADTSRIEVVVKVNMILDLRDMHKEDLELIYEEANITDQFRTYYPCNYLYLFGDYTTVQ